MYACECVYLPACAHVCVCHECMFIYVRMCVYTSMCGCILRVHVCYHMEFCVWVHPNKQITKPEDQTFIDIIGEECMWVNEVTADFSHPLPS